MLGSVSTWEHKIQETGGEDIISDTDMKEMFALYQIRAQTSCIMFAQFSTESTTPGKRLIPKLHRDLIETMNDFYWEQVILLGSSIQS